MGDTREDTSENGVVLNQKSKFSREKKKKNEEQMWIIITYDMETQHWNPLLLFRVHLSILVVLCTFFPTEMWKLRIFSKF